MKCFLILERLSSNVTFHFIISSEMKCSKYFLSVPKKRKQKISANSHSLKIQSILCSLKPEYAAKFKVKSIEVCSRVGL